ncbi:uncharacterized protein PFLUO_LOCUS429 [Penicillium psychrofluorescens]|uniref:uncharacterized protein n=1 Tax=Penicillium psychrofluorescens TaxID=3158075 RepID=UPI003CCCAEC1
MSSRSTSSNPGNLANQNGDEDAQRNGGTQWRKADRRATQSTTTTPSGRKGRRSPTPSRKARASSGSGALRRSHSVKRSRPRARPQE